MRNKPAQARRLELSFLIGRFVTDHLVRVHQQFEGDLVAALVMATVANRNMQRYYEDMARKSAEGLDKLVDSGDHLAHLRHCNAHSVASATGIPRETVRRKVNWLKQKGWLTVGARCELLIPAGIGRQFAQFDATTIDRFLETAREALQALDRQESATSP
jgi:response regulator of citrate/malate metabolism